MRGGELRAALFDLDGTLVDTEPQYTRFWAAEGRALGLCGEEFAMRIKGSTLRSVLDRHVPGAAERRRLEARVDEFERTMDFPLVRGALEFARDARRRGALTAIVTSSGPRKMEALRGRLPWLEGEFDLVLTAADFAAGKPAPDCYLLAARRLGVPPAACAVFEDAPNGLRAGRAAGMRTVGLTTGFPRELLAPLCDHVAPDFRSIDYALVCRLLRGEG